MDSEKILKEYTCIAFMHSYSGGMSGGDRICLEFAKRWRKYFKTVTLVTSREGVSAVQKYNITIPSIELSSGLPSITNVLGYLRRTLLGIRFAWSYVLHEPEKVVVYMSSDFWSDAIPALILKWRYPKVFLIGTAYLKAAAPWAADNPYRTSFTRFVIGCLYYLSQLPVLALVNWYSDMVFVTSLPDVKRFVTKRRSREAVVVVKGGVDLEPVSAWKTRTALPPVSSRKYDAVFVGRFHDQKGIMELLSLWRIVIREKPDAQLALIGEGPLEAIIKETITHYNLEHSVTILGFLDGEEKYAIFRNSKLFVHPAIYDSGGMAAAEGMAWGLPAVSFDLEALTTYYPKGMVKIPCYDEELFAQAILRLLHDSTYYTHYAQEAETLIYEEWGWDKRVLSVTQSIAQKIA